MLQRLNILLAARPRTAEAWLARMARPDAGAHDQAALTAWLSADPDHLRQYEQAKADQAALEPLRGVFADDLATLRRSPRPSMTRRAWLAPGLAAAAVAIAAVVVLPSMLKDQGRLYEAASGRITDIALEDGSRMTLDAGSAVRVALRDDARRATLERGAAYFEVAHNAARPFQVAVGDRRVIVTGTKFVTALTEDGAEVSLLQGRVAVGSRDATAKDALADALILSPGESRFHARKTRHPQNDRRRRYGDGVAQAAAGVPGCAAVGRTCRRGPILGSSPAPGRSCPGPHAGDDGAASGGRGCDRRPADGPFADPHDARPRRRPAHRPGRLKQWDIADLSRRCAKSVADHFFEANPCDRSLHRSPAHDA